MWHVGHAETLCRVHHPELKDPTKPSDQPRPKPGKSKQVYFLKIQHVPPTTIVLENSPVSDTHHDQPELSTRTAVTKIEILPPKPLVSIAVLHSPEPPAL